MTFIQVSQEFAYKLLGSKHCRNFSQNDLSSNIHQLPTLGTEISSMLNTAVN